MGKFKVGDRVRFVMDYGHAKKGDEGTIVSFWAEDGAVVTHKTVNHSCNFSRIELVPVASAEWQPKVGDRVVSDDEDNRGEVGTVVEGGYGYPGLIMVKFDTWRRGHDGVNLYGNAGKEHWLVQTKDLQPAPVVAAPATLTITAGGYYKTRDGRKVGPIAVAQGPYDPWPWKLASGTHYYRNDGHSCPGYADGHRDADDIIAEWVDEPVTIANDNAAPAKFKVGDRVKFRPGYASLAAGKEATVVAVNVWGNDGIQVDLGGKHGVSTESESDLVPARVPAIVALIENGIAKPATRPVVHASQEAATTEASRLALLHPGQEFGVFVLTDSKIADEVVTKTAVLRAA